MTYDDLVALALDFPEVEECLSYGTPALKRVGRNMISLKKDGATVATKVDWDTHDRLLRERPEVFFKTDHYETWPWLLVNLERLDPVEARTLVQASWEDAPFPGKRRK